MKAKQLSIEAYSELYLALPMLSKLQLSVVFVRLFWGCSDFVSVSLCVCVCVDFFLGRRGEVGVGGEEGARGASFF